MSILLTSASSQFLSQATGLSTAISGANQSLSISCYVKVDTDTADWQAFVAKDDEANSNRQYNLIFGNGGGYEDKVVVVLSNDGSSASVAYGATSLTLSQWYHVGMVYNDTDIRIYIDGLLDSNGADNPKAYTSGIYNGTNPFRIGCYSSGGTEYRFLNGQISDVAVWDIALSATEMFLLASRVKYMPLQIQSSNLQGYWPLDDYAHDTSITGNLSEYSANGTVMTPNASPLAQAEGTLSYPAADFVPEAIGTAGWQHKIAGIVASNLAKVNSVARVNIAKVNQT